MNDLAPTVPTPLAPTDTMSLLTGLVQSGNAKDNVEVLGKLLEYRRAEEDRQAEKDFNVAFIALQRDVAAAKIRATKTVPDKHGNPKFSFAPFDEIMHTVQPLADKHGIGITFSTRVIDGTPLRIAVTCKLRHIGGHSESNEFPARIGSGPPGCSETQVDGAASTYAKRFALCQMLNILIEGIDTDASTDARVSTVVSGEQVVELIRVYQGLQRAKVMDQQFMDQWWAFAGAAPGRFHEIQAIKHDRAMQMLRERIPS